MFVFNIKIQILNKVPKKIKCCYTRDVYFKPNPGKTKSYPKPGLQVLIMGLDSELKILSSNYRL